MGFVMFSVSFGLPREEPNLSLSPSSRHCPGNVLVLLTCGETGERREAHRQGNQNKENQKNMGRGGRQSDGGRQSGRDACCLMVIGLGRWERVSECVR